MQTWPHGTCQKTKEGPVGKDLTPPRTLCSEASLEPIV